MPELPEVETTCRAIREHLVAKQITKIVSRCPRLRYPITDLLVQQPKNQIILQVERRAKYIILHLTKGFILIHLGMSGHLRIVSIDTELMKHDHIDLITSDKSVLRYNDPRRFGLWIYCTSPPSEHKLLSSLGVEPLLPALNGDYLFARAKNKKKPIKAFIMANEIVVGVGNIYATESLFYAHINPQTPASLISLQQFHCLSVFIKKILIHAIERGGTTLKNFSSGDGKPGYFSQNLKIYGRQGQSCFRCGSCIEKTKISGRSSTFCPHCQPIFL